MRKFIFDKERSKKKIQTGLQILGLNIIIQTFFKRNFDHSSRFYRICEKKCFDVFSRSRFYKIKKWV